MKLALRNGNAASLLMAGALVATLSAAGDWPAATPCSYSALALGCAAALLVSTLIPARILPPTGMRADAWRSTVGMLALSRMVTGDGMDRLQMVVETCSRMNPRVQLRAGDDTASDSARA